MPRLSPHLLLLTQVLPITLAAAASCPCGYTLNDSTTLFTENLESDFTNPPADLISWTDSAGSAWLAQEYNVTPSAARGPYGKAAQLRNVVLDPGARDPGLQLWVRSQLTAVAEDGGGEGGGQMVPIAELVSARSDFLYGSFRFGMKTTAINGTCGAVFFYHNDSQEIDMEILSKQQQQQTPNNNNTLNLVLQSPASVATNYNAASAAGDFIPYPLPFTPPQEFHEYRFDWLPSRIDMYADSHWLHTFTENIPQSPGAIHLIHWSNGDPGWSAGPPDGDAVLTISYVRGVFNGSDSASRVCGHPDGTCEVGDSSAVAQPTPRPTTTTAAGTAGSSTSAAGSGTSSGAAGGRRQEDGLRKVVGVGALAGCVSGFLL